MRIHTPSPDRPASPWMNGWIHIRGALLDWVSGIKPGDVLNPPPSEPLPVLGDSLAVHLKLALEEIMIDAMDEYGAHVNYTDLRHSPAYKSYQTQRSPYLRRFDPDSLTSRDEQIAFWINLYNTLILDAVITFGVQRSVSEGRLGLLRFFRRAAYNVGGQRVSADDIEHGILRGNRGHPMLPGSHFAGADPRLDWVISQPDVRIHSALNCASRSCSPIRVYSPEKIDAQLELAARNFVDTNVKIGPGEKEISISTIFRWFEADFGGVNGVISFLLQYLPDDERRSWISENQGDFHIRYEPYDWGLNT